MSEHVRIIDANEGPAVERINPQAQGGVVLVCEHASNRVPESLAGLGLSGAAQVSHVAWDPGAEAVARLMARSLDAPLLSARFSRLAYDCNRPPDSASAMPERSEIHDIPGNHGLTDAERAERAREIYWPFHRAVDAELERLPDAAMVTVHSFTPVYFGRRRETEIGILHDSDARLADRLLGILPRRGSFRAERNRPYGPADGVTHTLRLHALPKGRLNVMIEIRNDLIATAQAQRAMAELLSGSLREALAAPPLAGEIPPTKTTCAKTTRAKTTPAGG